MIFYLAILNYKVFYWMKTKKMLVVVLTSSFLGGKYFVSNFLVVSYVNYVIVIFVSYLIFLFFIKFLQNYVVDLVQKPNNEKIKSDLVVCLKYCVKDIYGVDSLKDCNMVCLLFYCSCNLFYITFLSSFSYWMFFFFFFIYISLVWKIKEWTLLTICFLIKMSRRLFLSW